MLLILPQIKTLSLETNRTQVLQAEQNELKLKMIVTERDMWKRKIDETINSQSVTRTEVLMSYRHCLLYITNNNLREDANNNLRRLL